MPIPLKFYGDRPTITGDRQVPQLPITKAALPPINTDRYFRNSKHPDASAFNELNAHLNAGMLFRTKEVFSILGDLGSAPGIQATSTAGTRPRWRFAFHLSPYSHAILARAVLFPPSSNYANDTYATLKIYSDATETTLVGTTEFHYGPGPAGNTSVGGWQYHRVVDRLITGLTANTSYYGVWSDETYGRLQSACVADIQSMTENYDGYVPVNFTEQSQLLDSYRENLVTPIPALWKRGGAKVLQWTVNDQSSPRTIAGSTATNLLDGSSTSVTTATPGYALTMAVGKARLSQQSTGVPVVMKVFCSTSSATGQGRIYLKTSSGTVLQITNSIPLTDAPAWVSVTGTIPVGTAKYDLMFDNNSSGTLSVYAVSIYEYET